MSKRGSNLDPSLYIVQTENLVSPPPAELPYSVSSLDNEEDDEVGDWGSMNITFQMRCVGDTEEKQGENWQP